MTTIDGESLFFTSALNSRVVYAATAGGEVAAVFYIESNNDDNTAATVQSITFVALTHTDPNDPDDSVDFSDVLRVSAVITQGIGDDIFVDDDAPSITVTSDGVQLNVDETVLADDDTQSFAGEFDPDFGTDGAGDTGGIDYTLEATAGASGLTDTASGQAVLLSVEGDDVVGRTETGGDLVFRVSVDDDGNVTLNQERAIVHGDPDDPNNSETLAADELVRLVASITDADGDGNSDTLNIGQNLNFFDDFPTIDPADAEINLTVDESTQGVDADADFSNQFSHDFGEDGEGDITFALDVIAGASGLVDSVSGENVILSVLGGVVEGRTETGDELVFTASVDADGNVSLDQSRGVMHTPDSGPNQSTTLSDDTLVTLTATITDGDDDHDTAVLDIGTNLVFEDDAPVIESSPSAAILDNNFDPPTGGSGTFEYDIGADGHDAAFYTGGGSDFINMALSGSIGDPPGTAIVNEDIDLVSENSLSATFSFSFDYDADPITVGNPLTHATGTLVIDKDDNSYTVSLDDPIEGFSFSVLHTNELLRKAPPGNTGHPELVVTELADEAPAPLGDGFYVQFSSNSLNQANPTFGFNGTGDGAPVAGDTTFNAGQFVTNNHEDWVSATQSTNGVAGDTIQKGELLTLRFFAENILGDVNPNAPGGGTEKVDPTTTADGVAIKFDGIGNSEDLVVILDLIDENGVQTTRSIVVQNSDLIKGTVPSPYNTEFSLDNNDALLVMESNDYNAAGETFQIQGIQIMQSANGLTGSGINLNGAVDNPLTADVIEGGSPVLDRCRCGTRPTTTCSRSLTSDSSRAPPALPTPTWTSRSTSWMRTATRRTRRPSRSTCSTIRLRRSLSLPSWARNSRTTRRTICPSITTRAMALPFRPVR